MAPAAADPPPAPPGPPAHERLQDAAIDPATGVHTGTVEIDGQRLCVGIRPGPPGAAAAGRRPLLLFNGIGASLALCGPLMAALAERESLVFDVPGAGRSPAPRRPYCLSWPARLADGLLDRLGYGEVDVLGVSWGGALAQQFALQHGRRVHRLVLAATATGGLTLIPGRPSVLARLASPRRYLDPGYMRRMAPTLYGGRLGACPQALDLLAAHARGADPVGYRYQLLAMLGWTSLPWLWRIRQPTLVLAGGEDPLVPPANARLLAALLPDARLRVVDDGHLFLLTRTRELAPVIASFLDTPQAQG